LTPFEKIVGVPPSPVGYTLARLSHSVARVKISGRSALWGPKYGILKKPIFGVQLRI